jgi:O-acetyl-ADP-ribose deacetylase (regulator of RNase III)
LYDDDDPGQSEKQLRSAYINALTRAVGNGCKSIAFPLLSSGIYGYPKEDAIKIAASSIQSFPEIYNLNVILVVYDSDTLQLCKALLGDTVEIG